MKIFVKRYEMDLKEGQVSGGPTKTMAQGGVNIYFVGLLDPIAKSLSTKDPLGQYVAISNEIFVDFGSDIIFILTEERTYSSNGEEAVVQQDGEIEVEDKLRHSVRSGTKGRGRRRVDL